MNKFNAGDIIIYSSENEWYNNMVCMIEDNDNDIIRVIVLWVDTSCPGYLEELDGVGRRWSSPLSQLEKSWEKICYK